MRFLSHFIILFIVLAAGFPAFAAEEESASQENTHEENTLGARQDRVLAEKQMDTHTYAPDYCEFSATFPEKPYVTRRCEDSSEEKCYDLVSFTKVFDLSASVRVEIICNPSTPEMYEQLTTKAMESTVRAMTKGSVIEAYDLKSRQESTYRQAGLLGKGRAGVQDTIYIAQLWSGKKSMMSVEAEMAGEPLEAADALFASILRSIGSIEDNAATEESEEDSKEEPKEKEPEPKQ